ncbi:MAG: TonB-dependent receptor [Ignavibacteriaceae bacterium]|nr:TonB-dependent receptor [Ignavibacteriaceae bacterium]
MKKQSILCFAIMLFILQVTFGQNFQINNNNFGAVGKITGSIQDSATNKPIEYATISVIGYEENQTVTGGITDGKGKFIVEKIPFGSYKVKLTFIGYSTVTLDSIKITPQKMVIDLGVQTLSQKTIQMGEVEVTGQKSAIEFAIDKMVVNVEKTLPAAGGSVIDVLKNTPSVNVDMDNNISLRGNSNVTILLDGRPSGVTDPDMLEQMPASAIEKIEIVTNPSAKYDADGTAGIINLITKKQQEMNWNGMIQANAGTRDNYGSSINLNFKQNDWNIFGSYDNRFNTFGMSGTIDRYTILPAGNINAHQEIKTRYKGFSQNFKIGADYSLDELNSFNTSILFNNGDGKFDNKSENRNEVSVGGDSASNYLGNNNAENERSTFDYTLSYKRKFSNPSQELTADFYYSNSVNNEDLNKFMDYTFGSQFPTNTIDLERTFSDNKNRLTSIKADYVVPVGETGKFETGAKSIFRIRNIDYKVEDFDYIVNSWINDTSQSNDFEYDEQIHAAYAMYSDNINKFKYQVGLRLEQAITRSEQKTLNLEYKKNYFSVIPTIHLSQEIAEGQELKLSYSRRLNRPPIQMVNPFIRYMDPLNAWAGNPYLKPEYTDSYEFGHNLIVGKSSLFSNIFYRKIHDNINQLTELRENNVTVSTFRNISEVQSYGIEFNGFTQLFDWWNLNGGFSFYGTKFDPNTAGLSNTNTSSIWNTRLTSMINLGWNTDLQFNFFYMSSNVTPQSKSKGMFFSDLGLKKTLLDNKLSISFRVNDVFNAMKFRNETNGYNFYSTINFKPNSQVFSISIQYNINNYMPKYEKRNEDSNSTNENGNPGY